MTEQTINLGHVVGRDGNPGTPGSPGADGKSAYQAAVEGGYTGSESEFNSALSGIPNVVSVKSFGAVGDGVTDDSAAFNAWLTYIVESGVQGFIPNGVYLIKNGGITYRNANTKSWSIFGESTNGTVLKFGFVSLDAQPNCIDIRYCSNFELRNFTIECPGINGQETGNGLYLCSVNYATFENIEIKNCSRGGVLAFSKEYATGGVCDGLNFKNVNIRGVENDAPFSATDARKLFPAGWILSDCINSMVENSEIENIAWYGFEFKNYCKNSYFMNCNAKKCVTACHIGAELNKGDTYGVEAGGYINITCYDVDTPIVAGRCRNTTFDNIVSYYSIPYKWNSKNEANKNYSIRVQFMKNCTVRASIHNCPYGGVYASDESVGNVFRFDTFSVDPDSLSARNYFFDDSSVGNVVRCDMHPLDYEFLYPLADKTGGNLIIDAVTGSTIKNAESDISKKEYHLLGTDRTWTGDFNWAGQDLVKTNRSVSGIVREAYGEPSGKYIRVDYNFQSDNPYIDFRINGADGVVKVLRLSKDGVNVIA